ncbi:FAD-dependent oxidoreductase [Bradyrhizobium sp. U87765 SZCCT0131]|uniref:flavin monoamine oxidase family protein n=1 Tax=unclassified Bradyrhizobium TaxID=2631580 RepID=UPI001BA56CD9|nr:MULTISPECIES: NAD(P)/FAD-dependent oxidoreductase [unclassified Bradyrhizobium]MBR1216930.1 FAD-dependent oxidoreductase [Bradyrhizobium sp. U87765 SZCCT0131]MBR1259314.1 FAD-dependent oxidoreductase [Bradyrhizobium sp. U87765 SZCCT0134]MBR1305455.1 FAD-dependent oxidoreductase [Bradyrhizobium sp. U87765 SZCCT0110]MBR1321822.1 FAD-dependent oxidoreductase [Bradyrhizobium sp. U87765 SZCCT0109]MBR1350900.1 FAD-dependent oxidoreductase [Bradyrhizobium sp. U87765 SZCCT0048]
MSLPHHVDVAIIGAGAAGLAAARTLEHTGLSVLILEGRDRIGGRSHTMTLAGDIPFDLGCEWLHSADKNTFVPIARELGFAINTSRPRWREQTFNVGFAPDRRAAFTAAIDAFYDRAEAAARLPQDSAASDWLLPGDPWNPLMHAISTYVNGCELDRVSIYDMDAYEDTEVNWRLARGYGALIAAYGARCPVALDAAVTLIDHAGTTVRIETVRGTLTADRVIVTAPTTLLARESIRFSPALPDKVAAAAGLPLGVDDKVMLALDGDSDLPADGHLYAATDRAGIGSYHLRPMGLSCISGFFGGSYARALEDAGDGALAAQAIDDIVALLGSDYRRRLRPLAASRWANDPFALGAYSHALPGHAGDRAILAAPVDGRLFFAGEATSPNFFSTAHGARDSGERAAREVLEAVS